MTSPEEYYAGLSRHLKLHSLADPVSKFSLEGVIGEGTYGAVYAATDKDTGRRVAVKVMENIADNIEEIDEEYLVYRDLCLHPNVPSFYGVYFHPGKKREEDQIWFVMEVCISCCGPRSLCLPFETS